MGREHRLPGDARICEEGDRRDARVSVALPNAAAGIISACAATRRIQLDRDATIAGIDVGEDFLDLALLPPLRRSLLLARVDLRGIGREADGRGLSSDAGAIEELALRIARAVPLPTQGAIALVDSPRWPSDLDWSADGVVRRSGHSGGRKIDAALRAMVKTLRATGKHPRLAPLSMFPTPRFDYFGARIVAPTCKPHLRAMGCELFGVPLTRNFSAPYGGTFTRFMICGFATYRALAALGVETYEAYPDLQFRLWAGREVLPPKRRRSAALPARQNIVRRLADTLGTRCGGTVATLDAADAAILALSTAAASRNGAILQVEDQAEGRFIAALGAADARRLDRRD